MNAKVIQVIATEHCRGLGTTDDPCRAVTGYHSLDGELLAEVDPCGNLAAEKESTTVTKPESVTLVDRNHELSEVKARHDILLYQLKECEAMRDKTLDDNQKLRAELNVLANDKAKADHELALARAINHLTKPNPALENVLGKLRAIYNAIRPGKGFDSAIIYGIDAVAQFTYGDLRRWVESEKAPAP
jgi:hypothetical protein